MPAIFPKLGSFVCVRFLPKDGSTKSSVAASGAAPQRAGLCRHPHRKSRLAAPRAGRSGGVPPPSTMDYIEELPPLPYDLPKSEGEQYTYGQFLEKQDCRSHQECIRKMGSILTRLLWPLEIPSQSISVRPAVSAKHRYAYP